jgi:DNA-binding response OmpR family regulator
VLRRQGYKVETALNVAEALVIFESRDIDLVVTDYLLPEEDGIEMARKMKALKSRCRLSCFQDRLNYRKVLS